MKILSYSVAQTLAFGRAIARNLRQGDVICLSGQLGSGKTVLTKGIAQGLGIDQDDIVSPTFVLLRQYLNARIPLYHFDLYRLDSPADIAGLGYEEYLYGDGVTVIEWAEKLGSLLPQEYLLIRLSLRGANQRRLDICAASAGSAGRRYPGIIKKINEDIHT